jgi:hypothetical protein
MRTRILRTLGAVSVLGTVAAGYGDQNRGTSAIQEARLDPVEAFVSCANYDAVRAAYYCQASAYGGTGGYTYAWQGNVYFPLRDNTIAYVSCPSSGVAYVYVEATDSSSATGAVETAVYC